MAIGSACDHVTTVTTTNFGNNRTLTSIITMKYFVAALLLAQATAFTVTPLASSATSTQLFLEERINESIDLDSPKVATMDTIEKGKKVYCRCWQSGTFPLCDGAHMKHNEKTGDNVGPLIVSVKKEE